MDLRNRAGAAIGAGLLAIVAVSGCSSSGNTASPGGSGAHTYNIGAIGGPAGDPFWTTMQCAASKEASAEGANLTWKAITTAFDNAGLQRDVDAMLLQHPDGLLLSPLTAAGPITTINNKNIPLVELNTPSTIKTYYQSFTSASGSEQLAGMGNLIAQNAGNTGQMAVLAPLSGVPLIDARYQPIVAALKKVAPNITVLPTQYDSLDTNKAAAIASGLLVSNPDLKAIYTTTGPEGAGAVAAVAAAHKTGKVLVYTFDGTPEAVTALKAGSVAAIVSQSPAVMGRRGVQSLIGYLNSHPKAAVGDTATPQDVEVPLLVLTKDNIDSPQAQDYVYSATCS